MGTIWNRHPARRLVRVNATPALGPARADISFRALAAWRAERDLVELFESAWPAYRRYFLRDGEAARPSYAECRRALRQHMPELAPAIETISESVGGGDLQARFLSHWCPPPLFAACSMMTWTRGRNAILRNYDYPPLAIDGAVIASAFTGTRVLAMSDCLVGALDGVNEHGLAVALAFGGRPVVGRGFGIALVLRYLLECCATVAEAIAVLQRVPVHLAYNVALVDRSGGEAIVYVSPDRGAIVSGTTTCANRQGATEWPEHAAFCATVSREHTLEALTHDPTLTLEQATRRFLLQPLLRPTEQSSWGTVYTSVCDADACELTLHWPDGSWKLSLAGFEPGVLSRRFGLVPPPPRPREFRAATPGGVSVIG